MMSGNRINWIGKVVLVAALSIFALDASAQTKKLGFSGRPTNLHERNLDDYVDYSQIMNDLGERTVVINIGGYSFTGLLHDDGMKVPESVIDEDMMRSMLEKAGVTDVEKMMKMINQQ